MILANLIEDSYRFHQNKNFLEETDLEILEEAFFKHITDTFDKFKDKIINVNPFNVRKTEVKFDPSRRKFLGRAAKMAPAVVFMPGIVKSELSNMLDKAIDKYEPFHHMLPSSEDLNPKNIPVSPTGGQDIALKAFTGFNNALNSAANIRDFVHFNVKNKDLKNYINDFQNENYDKMAKRYIINRFRQPFLNVAQATRMQLLTHAHPATKYIPNGLGYDKAKDYNKYAKKFNDALIPVHDALIQSANFVDKLKNEK